MAPVPPPPPPSAAGDPGDPVGAVLDDRARQLAQRRVERAVGESHVIAAVGSLAVAVPTSRARRIVPSRPLSRLPGSGSGIAGIAGVHGALVPVVDLALLLRGGPGDAPPDGRLLLVDDERSTIALRVDRVTALGDLERHELPSDPTSPFVAGVAAGGVLVLDIDALLADPRLSPPGTGPDHTEQPAGGTH